MPRKGGGMTNVLQIFWKQIFGVEEEDDRPPRLRRRVQVDDELQATATIFMSCGGCGRR